MFERRYIKRLSFAIILLVFLLINSTHVFGAPVLEINYHIMYASNKYIDDDDFWLASVGGHVSPFADSDFTNGVFLLNVDGSSAPPNGASGVGGWANIRITNTGDQTAHIPAGSIWLYAGGSMARSMSGDPNSSAMTYFNASLSTYVDGAFIAGPSFHIHATENQNGGVGNNYPSLTIQENLGTIALTLATPHAMDVNLYLPAIDLDPGDVLALAPTFQAGLSLNYGAGATAFGDAGLHFNLPSGIGLGPTASSVNWIHPVPIPGTIWFIASCLMIISGVRRKLRK